MYTIEKGRSIKKVIEVTLEATATDTANMKIGQTFYVYNSGNAVMTIGAISSECLIPIPAGVKDGPFITKDGHFYTKGTAGQKAVIAFMEDLG